MSSSTPPPNPNGEHKWCRHFESKGFSTRALHVGQEPAQWNSRAVVPPIVMSTTFAQLEPGVTAGFDYGRGGNPTRDALEKCLASLEKAQFALCFSSGLATQAQITQLLNEGDHILAADELFGGTTRYFRTYAAKFSLGLDYADFCNPVKVAAAVKPNTRLVWFETPANPLLRVADIAEVCKAVKAINENAIIVVDNTFMGPYFQNPLELGVDISMNSITKYINGHSDAIMGSIATNRRDLYDQMKFLQNSAGSIPSPFECFLVNRGLKTLALRMEAHQRNALAIAHFLESHPLVSKVIYIGLPSHPEHSIVLKQCSGFGGMIGFYTKTTDFKKVRSFISKLQLFTLALSLGAVESLIEVPSMMTHASLPKETREELGILDNFIRLSIGIENVEDLIADLDQALKFAHEQ